ncbi:MAG: energy transducer TonB [Pyrinomonadaceae bacterium]
MAKVVKYCAACEEGFSEKFSFCPNCAGALAAYEMKPVSETVNSVPVNNIENNSAEIETVERKKPVFNEAGAIERAESFSPADESEDFFADDYDDELIELDSPAKLDNPIGEEIPAVVTLPAANTVSMPETVRSAANDYQSNGTSSYKKAEQSALKSPVAATAAVGAVSGNRAHKVYDDGNFHITFVEERNRSGRNLLLLGSFLMVAGVALGGMLYSLFTYNAMIGSLSGDDSLLAYISEEVPMPPEIDPPKKNPKKDDGGGGGGGKENPEPATKGRLPNQVDRPIMPPQPLPKVTNASLPNPNETQGKIKRESTDEPVGVPYGSLSDRLSSGSGSGGGIGNGRGTGVGSGRGTGEGSGIGSGSGGGNGNGNGDGSGGGGSGSSAPPKMDPPKPKGPTQGIAILSKPRPSYTDAARQNQVTGVVRLRVTFLASGQVGSVTPVSGLSYGLTEQAIAAAKQIRFSPALVNGEPKTVTKQIEYSFSIY